MKREIMLVMIVLLMIVFLVEHASAIGMSPARSTFDLLEYNCAFNSNIGYILIRPSGRYSMFSAYDAAGLTVNITGCSASSNSVKYIDSKTILIDWQSTELASTSQITATINAQSPAAWNCPVTPGGGYMADLVRHSDAFVGGSGINAGIACVAQLALYRNYAPRPYAASCPDIINANQAANFVFRLEDNHGAWFSPYPDKNYNGGPWLSYSIDWEGDGIIDITSSTTFDEDPVPYPGHPGLWKWTDGIQASTLSLDHTYDFAGDYSIIVKVWDTKESTTLEIPIHVIPEPATFLLLAIGGIFLNRNGIKRLHWGTLRSS